LFELFAVVPVKAFSDSFAYFSPAIVKSFGHSAIQTQLYTVPPWAVAFVVAMISATLSDKCKNRFGFFSTSIAITITGYIILLTAHDNKHVEYGALFITVSGIVSAVPVVVGWFSTNRKFTVVFIESSHNVHLVAGHTRRSIGIAWQIGFGNSEYDPCALVISFKDI
jgi:hypothetical protein